MLKTASVTTVQIPQSFTDVLYLSSRDDMPVEIKRMLKQKKLSFSILPISQFRQILGCLDLIGTVIIDAQDSHSLQQQKLAQTIEILEMHNIGTILLSSRTKLPVKSFSLAAPQVKSFSLATKMESVSVDELWARISVNLAYRKKSEALVVKPAMPPSQDRRVNNNKLSEQLSMAGALVETLAEQLRMAGLVQRDFLPTQLPITDRIKWAASFMPAEWVSGDIYDIVRVDEQHIGFYIADAVGHSMPAALLTIFIKQALIMRETLENDHHVFSPAEVMKNLNMRMASQKLSGYQFATCCYGLLNTSTLQLTYARAGHPYPVLLRKDQPPKQLEIRGSLLGIFPQSDYAQQTIQLQAGDKLLLYSDGAEPFIGGFDDSTGFNFTEEFCQISELPLLDMFDKLNKIVQNGSVHPSETDDITAVGLEIT